METMQAPSDVLDFGPGSTFDVKYESFLQKKGAFSSISAGF